MSALISQSVGHFHVWAGARRAAEALATAAERADALFVTAERRVGVAVRWYRDLLLGRGRALAGFGDGITAAGVAFEAAQPVTLAAQWERVAGQVAARAELARQAGDLQAAAAEQVDAAGYALKELLAELEGVMTLPGPVPAERTTPDPWVAPVAHERAEGALAA
jgi:hypothetical protein